MNIARVDSIVISLTIEEAEKLKRSLGATTHDNEELEDWSADLHELLERELG